jgi:hypothetical protein
MLNSKMGVVSRFRGENPAEMGRSGAAPLQQWVVYVLAGWARLGGVGR